MRTPYDVDAEMIPSEPDAVSTAEGIAQVLAESGTFIYVAGNSSDSHYDPVGPMTFHSEKRAVSFS